MSKKLSDVLLPQNVTILEMSKVEFRGNKFLEPPANNSSITCSSCGEKGGRLSQHEFVCKNQTCLTFGIIQQADVNAARNHKKSSNLELKEVKYTSVRLKYGKFKRFKKRKVKSKI